MLPLGHARHFWHARRLAEAPLLHRTGRSPRAESGVRDLYAASGLPQPRYFLWFDSPFGAAWTVAMLHAKHDDVWGRIVREASRSTAQRQKMESVQADNLPSRGRGGLARRLFLHRASFRLPKPRKSVAANLRTPPPSIPEC